MARVVVVGGNSQRSHSDSITVKFRAAGTPKEKIKTVNPLQDKT